MKQTIATRTFFVAPGMETTTLSIAQPEEVEEGTWQCETALTGHIVRDFPIGYGVDAVQALEAGLKIAELVIHGLREYKEGRLCHSDGSKYGPLPDAPG